MAHRIALGLGRFLWEVDAMPSSEFARWERYWRVEPWGAHRDNLHAALISRQIWRAFTGADRDLDEFMLRPVEPPKPETREERYERMRAAWHAVG